MRALKILLIIGINFIVLIAIGVFALSFFVKTDKIKTEIAARVSSFTGLPFVINGKMHFSVFPVFGVQFQDAELGNPVEFDQSLPMIEVKEGDVGMSLSSLLKGDVVIKKIILNQPIIRMAQNKNEKWNFSMLSQDKPPVKSASSAVSAPDQSTKKEVPARKTFTIPDIFVKNGDVLIQSAKGEPTEISNINLSFDHGEIHSELPFSASFVINQPNLKGTVEITGQFFEEDNDRWDIRLLVIDANLMNGKTPIKSHMTTDIMIDSSQIKTNMLGIVINGSTLTGDVVVSNYKSGVNALVVDGKIAVDKINLPFMNVSNLSAKIQGKNGVIQLLPLSAVASGSSVSGSAGVDFTKKTPRIFLKINASRVNLQKATGVNNLTGYGSVSANLSANGFDNIMRTLNGNLAINVPSGRITGFDLSALIRTGLAIASINPALLLPPKGYTDFKNAKATATIQGGILSNRDFSMDTADAKVNGSGSIDFLAWRINYELEATPRGINNIVVPVAISGDLSNPDVELNKQKILAEVVRGILMQPLDKTKKTIALPADLLKAILH